ncbi:MAG: Hsp70 family protein [Bryobacteraceae bacterium]
MAELIVGIDLGTTNSEIAAFTGDKVSVLGPGDTRILPSCVGFSPTGELLVGEAARNQHKLYPERTVRSIKRKMGTTDKVRLGDKEFLPQEISALILRELAEWATRSLGQRPEKAVITVPAYFSDAQRNATREAGALAGLEVVRILNEPTAASLAYGYGEGKKHTAMVYDLGGGTFDVSIVTMEGDVTEVLASHGNNNLGGDDFDDLLAEKLAVDFQQKHGVNLRDHPAARARLWWAAEEAKKQLSSNPYARIREEALLVESGKPLHLDTEITREEYEEMIRPLCDTTLDSVSKALRDSGKRATDLDAILLVGGSTRTPLISRLLEEHSGLAPRQDVHPDLCVALGAGVLASRLGGHGVDRVLVDVSPYTFGVSFLGLRGGYEYPYCYKPIIKRNTPLPVTRTERFYTTHPEQTVVEIEVFQGDDDDALKNIPVGNFKITGLTELENDLNEVHCRMKLDLDGILEVTAIEKRTGKTKQIVIDDALKSRSQTEIAAARKRLQDLYSGRAEEVEATWEESAAAPEGSELDAGTAKVEERAAADEDAVRMERESRDLLGRARELLSSMHPDDREEAINLIEEIDVSIRSGNAPGFQKATGALRELLFFVGGKQ